MAIKRSIRTPIQNRIVETGKPSVGALVQAIVAALDGGGVSVAPGSPAGASGPV